ncbi:hypothetical protein N7499_011792 [Penicillium canescens]|uniref:CENP-V/GFA domain-containing protein n=1 Tax=Penicillium canescens TaxID=5083 RepID=A0AAD6IMN0_PENCN|nr:hypothetical protein N7444_006337 [Penicillium canescens]KAJ6052411.1 hypothetical protein N7460_002945 [Penicillium canescens]KAJ6069905.1 hypothetical protein N7499_011792 [Penicillium canescens]
MSETQDSFSSYDGSCHCGQVSFTAQLSSPIGEQVVNTCNCSICSINAYIMVYVQKANLTFHNSDDAVKEYRFGTMKYPHGFCPNCGTSVYLRALDGEYKDIVAVNGRTLKDVDFSTMKIEELNGKRINAG